MTPQAAAQTLEQEESARRPVRRLIKPHRDTGPGREQACSQDDTAKPGFISPAEQQNHLKSPTPASQVRLSRMETQRGYSTSWETLMTKLVWEPLPSLPSDALLNPGQQES